LIIFAQKKSMTSSSTVQKPKRKYIPESLTIDSWGKLKSFFDDLANRDIQSSAELEKWLIDGSELSAVMEEDMAWRYIKMNIDTTDSKLQEEFNFWIKEISPNVAPFAHQLNLKLINSPFVEQLNQEKFKIYLRGVKNQIEIYREENIPLFTILQEKQQTYGSICAAMTIEHQGETLTLQQATQHLKSTDRSLRESTFIKVNARRLKDVQALDDLFDELISLRQKISKNAGFNNFRDYMFAAMGRFDYSVSDCFNFHSSVQEFIVPIISKIEKSRKNKLNVSSYKPWDTQADANGELPLKPFDKSNELIEKSITCFNKLDPYFGSCLTIMNNMQHLDLESKLGKAPGGFMYPLYEIGVPFIFMNAVGSQRDVVTMIHEGGHAVHSFLSRDLELTEFKSTPSEVAELASMSMELLTMDNWDVFYSNASELKRAKIEQLEKALEGLPWIAAIDQFQHWIYTNEHTANQRREKWIQINEKLGNQIVDWSGYEDSLANQWQKQLHLYEVPFYYIEYGMAQLGAIAVWRNYKQKGNAALEEYKAALKLGYTKSIGEIYEEAGIKFDFSSTYIEELAAFIMDELSVLINQTD
jgi:oligoendopeptidase F